MVGFIQQKRERETAIGKVRNRFALRSVIPIFLADIGDYKGSIPLCLRGNSDKMERGAP